MEIKVASSDTISKIDLLKTGSLFSLALVCGCLIANKKGDIEVWRNIGYKAGLAFQIQDDCLDVISSEEKLGKSISDEKNQKSTFVCCAVLLLSDWPGATG